MKDGTVIKGGKGSMPDAGNRIPFIVNCLGTIKPDQVRQEIIDFSDILPPLRSRRI
jgi:arylsulfatase A-like enzyme